MASPLSKAVTNASAFFFMAASSAALSAAKAGLARHAGRQGSEAMQPDVVDLVAILSEDTDLLVSGGGVAFRCSSVNCGLRRAARLCLVLLTLPGATPRPRRSRRRRSSGSWPW